MEIENFVLPSGFLERDVIVDLYFRKEPAGQDNKARHLLLINDGQDLVHMDFDKILDDLFAENAISSMVCVGIHCGPDRRNEYGVVNVLDYLGRGSKAGLYEQFIFDELLPRIDGQFSITNFESIGFGGFSLGGLSAMDLVWRNPHIFKTAGLFSGSFWWRSVSQHDEHFDEHEHRIMHREIRNGQYALGLKFFFETGTHDETADRNHNGIIDSIDDTLSLIDELMLKGYRQEDIRYMEFKDGHHDVSTWARAFPFFLKWAYNAQANYSSD